MEKLKSHKPGTAFVAIVFAGLALITLALFIMLYFTLITSLKEYIDYKLNPIGFPEKLMFVNYAEAFSAFSMKIGQRTVYLEEMFLNSFIYSIGSAFAATLVPCIVAYLNAKYKMWFNKVIFTTVIISMTMPIVGALPSEIQIVKALGLDDKLIGPIIMKSSYLGMYFLMFYGAFKGLSDEYIEAATIDGAGQWQVLMQIVMPLVKTTFGAIFLLNFIVYWNDYQSPMIYLKSYPTVAVGLFRYVYIPNTTVSATTNMQMAGCILLFLPIFIIFLIFKNKLMGNLTVGGIKG